MAPLYRFYWYKTASSPAQKYPRCTDSARTFPRLRITRDIARCARGCEHGNRRRYFSSPIRLSPRASRSIHNNRSASYLARFLSGARGSGRILRDNEGGWTGRAERVESEASQVKVRQAESRAGSRISPRVRRREVALALCVYEPRPLFHSAFTSPANATVAASSYAEHPPAHVRRRICLRD